MFYVYAYLDPRKKGKFKYNGLEFNYQPFYIGKGKGKRCCRAIEPNKLKKQRKSIKREYIKKLISLGLKPIVIKLFENLTETEAFEKEVQLIESIGRMDLKTGPLSNMTEGGDGISGNILTEETKRKISQSHKGKKLTEEHKFILSQKLKGREPWNKGKKLSKETKEKMSSVRGGKEYSENRSNSYLIISPDGIEYQVKGLKDFCEEHSLSLSQMRRVSKGVLETYKSWKCITLTTKYNRNESRNCMYDFTINKRESMSAIQSAITILEKLRDTYDDVEGTEDVAISVLNTIHEYINLDIMSDLSGETKEYLQQFIIRAI